ncbi:hypothetical protein BgiBS90_025812, partial [Biomphalaria glabrata]
MFKSVIIESVMIRPATIRTLKLYFQLTVLLVVVSVFIFVLYDFNLKNHNLTTI